MKLGRSYWRIFYQHYSLLMIQVYMCWRMQMIRLRERRISEVKYIVSIASCSLIGIIYCLSQNKLVFFDLALFLLNIVLVRNSDKKLSFKIFWRKLSVTKVRLLSRHYNYSHLWWEHLVDTSRSRLHINLFYCNNSTITSIFRFLTYTTVWVKFKHFRAYEYISENVYIIRWYPYKTKNKTLWIASTMT